MLEGRDDFGDGVIFLVTLDLMELPNASPKEEPKSSTHSLVMARLDFSDGCSIRFTGAEGFCPVVWAEDGLSLSKRERSSSISVM